MPVVCPSCDAPPSADARPGAACLACGAPMIAVKGGELAAGSVVDGRFEIRERLGAGGMGVVYRATQLSIGRDVALKVLSTIESEPMVKRFFREAKIASALAHQNTVQIIEFGQDQAGHVYLAMELVRGHTLLAEVEQGAMAPRRVARIGIQLCDALEAAHRHAIVHRDLKLENVMISEDGNDHVKVLDFGIARIQGDVNTQVTAQGLAAGTPHYMAPEVLAQAAEPEPAQDMYALGVILAELALGEPLWTNVTSLQMLLIEKIRGTAIERVPGRIRGVVQKLLDQDPANRPKPVETRRLLREMERATTDPVGIAATAEPMQPLDRPVAKAEPTSTLAPSNLAPSNLAPIDLVPIDLGKLEVLQLDEREAPVKAPPPVAFAPPVLESEDDKRDVIEPGAPLELERDWNRERVSSPVKPSVEARRFAKDHSPVKRSGGGNSWIVVLLLVLAAGGGGAFYYTTRKHAPAPPPLEPTRGVSIRIVGKAGETIKIDGKPAGKTPLLLDRRRSKRPIRIEATGVLVDVVPDHNQTINLDSTE